MPISSDIKLFLTDGDVLTLSRRAKLKIEPGGALSVEDQNRVKIYAPGTWLRVEYDTRPGKVSSV